MWDAWQEQTALTAARKVLRKNRSPQAAAQAVLEAAGSVRKAGSADAIVAISIPEPLPKCEPAIALEAWLQDGVRHSLTPFWSQASNAAAQVPVSCHSLHAHDIHVS